MDSNKIKKIKVNQLKYLEIFGNETLERRRCSLYFRWVVYSTIQRAGETDVLPALLLGITKLGNAIERRNEQAKVKEL